MTAPSDGYKRPSVSSTRDGALRTVGFELEFSGLDLKRTVDVVADAVHATVRSQTDAEYVLRSEALGDFTVELDWEFLKRKAAEAADRDMRSTWLETLGNIAGLVVPVEVACPPVPIDSLDSMDGLVEALRDAGATGTEASLLAAYGVHINAEMPRLDAQTLNAYLSAFALLQWWLVRAHGVDISRRVTSYVALYSNAYVTQLLSRSAPTMDEIFADYLEHNADRNRALDMLPLLAHIDEARIAAAVGDEKIKARPTVHYRLPNCSIERSDWLLSNPWNIWCVVEELAARPDELADLSAEYLAAGTPVRGVNRRKWVEYADRWLKQRQLA